ncbi:hypothetical protein MKX01_009292 [Papaver californicum]|nr:hypothetical protein MKX01_009292 [Papaver californicum]
MEEINEVPKSVKGCHIVAVPFPGRGLINPMMNFCKHLAHKLDNNVKITFVVTEEWELTIDFDSFLEIVVAEMEAPVVHVLNTSNQPATQLFDTHTDFYLMWAISIGNQRNIPVVSFWTSTSLTFSVMYHADLLTKKGHDLANLSDCCDEVIDYIPGVSPTRLVDMPLLPSGNDPKFNPAMVPFTMLDEVQCLLIATIYELEPQVTDTLKEIFPFPTYTIGPSIDHHHMKTESSTNKNVHGTEHYYLEWLDSQPIGSILAGLRESGVRYLLVSRGFHLTSGVCGDGCGGDDDEISTSSRRLVVPWCEQSRVLCHPSVGGFFTHCGWNSIMESVYAGVPMLTFPLSFDQIPNRKLIVEDLKVGMNITKGFGAKTFVKRHEVEKIVKKFMDINEEAEEDNEAKEMRRRSMELKEMCRRALAKGGSSDTNLDSFIKDFLYIHGN